MPTKLEQVCALIEGKSALHAKKIRKNLADADPSYLDLGNGFLQSYCDVFSRDGHDLSYGVDCYLRMIGDMMYEQLRFIESGTYSSSSFEEVNQRVYSDPEVMEYYMHGLILSQVLWKHHCLMLRFFIETVPRYITDKSRYLEIGGGHGLFLSKSIELTADRAVTFDLVDISQTSLDLACRFVQNDAVTYCLSDIFDFAPDHQYGFITMGEVLEHVENPQALLKKLYELLEDDGHAFITVPGNAPAIDHIYLFRHVDELTQLIHDAGFEIVESRVLFAEDAPEDVCIRMKIPFLFGGILRKCSKAIQGNHS